MNELALVQDFTHEQKYHMGVSLCVLVVAQIQMTTQSAVLEFETMRFKFEVLDHYIF